MVVVHTYIAMSDDEEFEYTYSDDDDDAYHYVDEGMIEQRKFHVPVMSTSYIIATFCDISIYYILYVGMRLS